MILALAAGAAAGVAVRSAATAPAQKTGVAAVTADLPGARTHWALFDNVVKSLLQASGKSVPAGAVRHE